MADKYYRALQDALKVLIELPGGTHAEQFVALYAGGNRPVVDAHTQIHHGETFTADHVVASLANNGVINLIITTPANDWPHLIVNAAIGGDGLLQIYEGAVFTGGTPVNVVNHKFYSTNVAGETVVHTPTISNDGVNKIDHYIPGGTGGVAVGGVGGRHEEILLKPATNYLIRLTNVSGQARRAAIDLLWYQSVQIPDGN